MNSQPPASLQTQLLQILSILSEPRQQELLDFALFLHQQELAQVQEQNLSETLPLKAEFAEEDRAMSEMILPDYAATLKHEENA